MLGMSAFASAQSMSNTPSNQPPPSPAVAEAAFGLVGDNYTELDFGYQKQREEPDILRDYGLIINKSLLREGMWGTDGNLSYDYLAGYAGGLQDRRDEAQAGLTEYVLEGWGKPFVTADGGYAWERAGNVSKRSFAYTLTGGVEFSVLQNFALTPFAEYQAEPSLTNGDLPLAHMPDHLWTYGVKATYWLSREWSASLTGDFDQYNRNDLGYKVGVTCHF